MSAHPEKRAEIFGNIFALRICLSLFAMLASVATAFIIPKYTGTPIPLGIAIASATTFLTIVFGTLSSLLQVDLRMQWNALGLVASKFVALGWMLATIFKYFPDNPEAGFFQLLIAGIVGGIFQVAIVLWAARGDELKLRFDFRFWKEILIKTLPYGGAVLLATIYVRLDVILLSLMRNSTEVGIYGVAARVMENLAVISILFLNSTLPAVSRLFRTNKERLKKMLQYSFDFLSIIALPIVVGGSVLAYPIVALVSSPEFLSNPATGFYGSDLALQILLFTMLLAYFGNLLGFALLAGNAQLKLFYVNSSAVVFNLVLNLAVIPFWGFRGAAVASVASQIFVCTLDYIFLRKIIDITFNLRTTIKATIAAAVMGSAVWWLEPIFLNFLGPNKGVLLLIPVGGLVYGLMLLLLRAITPEMRALLRKQA